jgi:hypothetical protein
MVHSAILTRYVLAISLLTTISAQSSEDVSALSSILSPTTSRDTLGTGTSSISLAAPTGTGEPCARIARAVETSRSSVYRVAVPAKLAYECLTSVPVKQSVALGTIDAIVKMAQFQSNLAYIRNPPEGYDNRPVDVLAGLADIRSKVSDNAYANQFDFEADISSLFNSARDGHLGFDGPTFAGAVGWRRDVPLISVSRDGGPAKIYDLGMAISDFV